jgi:predicted nucleic acid-binding protein
VKIFVDVNIFEDIYRQRPGWEASLAIIAQVANGEISGCVSALTPPILYFLRRRTQSEQASRRAVRQMLISFTIIPFGKEVLEAAYQSALPDFEDSIQLECAKIAAVDRVVTRNKRHFRQSEVVILTPEELLKEIGLIS